MNSLLSARYSLRSEYAWSLIVVLVSAFFSSFLSLQAGIFILLFAVIGWWVWDHPKEGFLFFIIVSPLLPALKVTQTITSITLVKDVIILVLVVRLFLLALFSQKLPYRRAVLLVPLLALLLWTGVEALRADTLILGMLRARDIALYAFLYIATLYLPWNRKFAYECLVWFLLSFLIVLVLGVYQWFFAADSAVLRFDPASQVWIPRLSSTLAHPSVFGHYLLNVITLCSAGAIVFFTRKKLFLIFVLLLIITLPFVYLTYSRAVWIGFLAAVTAQLTLYLALLWRTRAARLLSWQNTIVAAVFFLVIIVVLIRFTAVGIFLHSTFDPTYQSNLDRLEFAVRLVAPMTTIEAIVGRGLGDVVAQQFRTVDLEAYDLAIGSARSVQLAKDKTLVDNQHLKTFVEMGLIGLLIYGWIYWRFAQGSFLLAAHVQRNGTNACETRRLLGLWSIGFLTAFIIQGFFIDIWDIFPTNASFWIVAAIITLALTSAIFPVEE